MNLRTIGLSLMLGMGMAAHSQIITFKTVEVINRSNKALELQYELVDTTVKAEVIDFGNEYLNNLMQQFSYLGSKNITGTMRIPVAQLDTGWNSIESMEVTAGGKTYRSEEFKVYVYPPLPEGEAGIWMSYVQTDKDVFLVVEQKIWTKTKTKGKKTTTYTSQGDYAELKLDKFNDLGISLSYMKSNSSIERIDGNEEEYLRIKSSTYKMKYFGSVSTEAVIDKSYFDDLPKKLTVHEIRIPSVN